MFTGLQQTLESLLKGFPLLQIKAAFVFPNGAKTWKNSFNSERALQAFSFFFFFVVVGGGIAAGDQGKEAKYASRLMVRIHGGSRYLGSGWRLQPFHALSAKTMNIRVEIHVLRLSVCFCRAQVILWESGLCPSCFSFRTFWQYFHIQKNEFYLIIESLI